MTFEWDAEYFNPATGEFTDDGAAFDWAEESADGYAEFLAEHDDSQLDTTTDEWTGAEGDIVDQCGCSWWEADEEGRKGEIAEQCYEHRRIARREREKRVRASNLTEDAEGLVDDMATAAERLALSRCGWCGMVLSVDRWFPMSNRRVCGADCLKRPERSELHQSTHYASFNRIVAGTNLPF